MLVFVFLPLGEHRVPYTLSFQMHVLPATTDAPGRRYSYLLIGNGKERRDGERGLEQPSSSRRGWGRKAGSVSVFTASELGPGRRYLIPTPGPAFSEEQHVIRALTRSFSRSHGWGGGWAVGLGERLRQQSRFNATSCPKRGNRASRKVAGGTSERKAPLQSPERRAEQAHGSGAAQTREQPGGTRCPARCFGGFTALTADLEEAQPREGLQEASNATSRFYR